MEIKKAVIAGVAGASLCGMVGLADVANAGEVREVREVSIIQDTGSTRMVTKIYYLQNTLAGDVVPFVAGAVERMDQTGSAKSLNYKKGGKQILVVTMREDRVEQIDDLVAKLDKPGLVGTGIHDFTYSFKYRTASAESDNGLEDIIEKVMDSDDSTYVIDEADVYIKDSKSDGSGYIKVLEQLDQPVPQVEVTLKRYQIWEDDLMDLGVDYKAFYTANKANFFKLTSTSVDDLGWEADSNINVAENNTSKAHFFGGSYDFQFDAGYLRFANTVNKDVRMTTASIVVRNSSEKPSMKLGGLSIELEPNCYQPGNVFRTKLTIDGYDGDTKEHFYTRAKIKTNEEIALFQFADEIEAKEYVGMPFLGDIPVFKYLVGREISVSRKLYNFITITAKPVSMETNMNEMADETIAKSQFK